MAGPPVNQDAAGGWGKRLSTVLWVLLLALMMGVAGSLFVAMLVSVFTLDLSALARAAWVLLERLFLDGLVFAAGATVAAGLVALVFARRSVFTISLGVGAAVFFGNALYGIFQAALIISPWGSYIGAGLGGLASIPTGISMTKKDRTPKGLRAAALKAAGSKGPHPLDVEFWRASDD